MADSSATPTPRDPHFWQARYETGDTPWDKGVPAPPLLEFLQERPISGKILVPGCGSGHDVRLLAAGGAEVTGLDVAPAAIQRAKNLGATPGTEFVEGDFFELPGFLHGGFDWVFEHTCFCAIHPSRRACYVEACLAALKPRGRILAVFYVDPENDDPESPPFGVTEEELDRLFGGHFRTLESRVPRVAFPGREGRELVRVLERIS